MGQTREDDFIERRKHLEHLEEKELEELFWKLCDKMLDPVMELAQSHTTPSIERSVLLRMGFSSMEAKAIVHKVIEHNLMGKGAGNIVYKLSTKKEVAIRDAGMMLIEQSDVWEEIETYFEEVKA